MRVTHIPCGPAVNESERKAIAHLKNRLEAEQGDDEWLLLTNLNFSAADDQVPHEIDIIAIGPPGFRVIEVKHWDADWVNDHLQYAGDAASRISLKARRIRNILCQKVRELPRDFWVDRVLLLTRDNAGEVEQRIREVRFYRLENWRDVLGLNRPRSLSLSQVKALGKAMGPKPNVAIDGELSCLADYVDLDLLTSEDERFHRIYRGKHSTRNEPVLLHLYDMSATALPNRKNRAQRECEAFRQLRLHPWVPTIVDTFQEAPEYAGEMWFFTVSDSTAPSIEERAAADAWDTKARLVFAKEAVTALIELHKAGEGGKPMLHRNLTPETIRVKHDNTPLLTDFRYARIPGEVTVAGTGGVEDESDAVAPEIRRQDLGAADRRSDVYSLCASLSVLFAERDDDKSRNAMKALAGGTADDPGERATLEELLGDLSILLDESSPHPIRWTNNQIVNFRGRDYRIVERLGLGGFGLAFKVMQIDRETGQAFGLYVGKTIYKQEKGQRVLAAYNLARPHLAGSPALSAIFETVDEWQEKSFVVLMQWIEGKPLEDLDGDFREEQVLHWLRTVCGALGVLHCQGLIHGDVSPSNLIVDGDNIVLIDYDGVAKIGESASIGTNMYRSPTYGGFAAPADDFFALGASVFHALFDTVPFMHGDSQNKECGLNWDGVQREDYPTVAAFLEQATHPDPAQRFTSADEAIDALDRKKDEAITALDRKKSESRFYCTSDATIKEGAIGLRLGTNVFTAIDVHWQLTTQANDSLLITGSSREDRTTCLLNLCRQMVETDIQPIIFSGHWDIDERLRQTGIEPRSIEFGVQSLNPLHMHGEVEIIDQIAGLQDLGKAEEIAESKQLTIIRTHQQLYAENLFLNLCECIEYISARSTPDRITHVLIFDETHRAFWEDLRLQTTGMSLGKSSFSVVLASGTAQDFSVSSTLDDLVLQSAEEDEVKIFNYLVLQSAEEDAESLLNKVSNSKNKRVWSNAIQQMEQSKALYFCNGEAYFVKLSLPDAPGLGVELDMEAVEKYRVG